MSSTARPGTDIRIGIETPFPECGGFSTLAFAPGPERSGGACPAPEPADPLASIPEGTDLCVIAPPGMTQVSGFPDQDGVAGLRRRLSLPAESGRLCALLFTFPPDFGYRTAERRHLDRLARSFPGMQLAVEFLSPEWFTARVVESLKERRIAWCVSDMARTGGSPPPCDLVTAGLAIVRFHGRGPVGPDGRAGSSCRHGGYREEELAAWIPRLRAMAQEADRLRVYFSTDPPRAAADARRLRSLALPGGLPAG